MALFIAIFSTVIVTVEALIQLTKNDVIISPQLSMQKEPPAKNKSHFALIYAVSGINEILL